MFLTPPHNSAKPTNIINNHSEALYNSARAPYGVIQDSMGYVRGGIKKNIYYKETTTLEEIDSASHKKLAS